MFRKSLAVAVSAIALLTACDQNTTGPAELTTEASIQMAIMGSGAAFPDGGAQPAILQRLVHAAMMKIRKDQGAEAAQAAEASLKPLVTAVRTAHQAKDSAAVRTAVTALRTAEATLVVNTLGTEVVTKTVDAAADALARFKAGLAKAAADGRDVTRGNALAATLQTKVDAAKTGRGAAALLNATDVLEALHMMNRFPHREPGDSAPRRRG